MDTLLDQGHTQWQEALRLDTRYRGQKLNHVLQVRVQSLVFPLLLVCLECG
jgi:hypothetical protein